MLNAKIFCKCFGTSTRDLSFRLRYPNFLLSKFASQSKLIKSVVRIGILGICVTNSQGPAFRILGFRVTSPKSQGPSSEVLGVRVPIPGCWVSGSVSQDTRVSGSRVPGSRVSGPKSWVLGLSVPGSPVSGFQGPGFQVLILGYALFNLGKIARNYYAPVTFYHVI